MKTVAKAASKAIGMATIRNKEAAFCARTANWVS